MTTMDTTTKKMDAGKSLRSLTKKTPGSALVTNLGKHSAGVSKQYAYWIGTLPGAPTEGINCAGIDFPKMTEQVIGKGRDTRRIPRIGSIRHLAEDQIDMLRDRLPANVVRFHGPELDHDMRGTLEDLEKPRRKGHLIRIPTEEQLAAAKTRGRTLRRYVAGSHDEPAAKFMFALLCENQKNPSPGSVYPEPLSETGLEWPED